jgi:hypothetical protein
LEASGNRESIHAARITVNDSLIELVGYWSPTSEQTKDAEIIWLTLLGLARYIADMHEHQAEIVIQTCENIKLLEAVRLMYGRN